MVTGSSGFIGHWLVRALKERGYYVVGLDNFATGKQEYARECDDFKRLNICRISREYLEGIDYVFHLAARARIAVVDQDPVSAENINVAGTLQLLQAAKKAGVKKVVYSSSSSIYGDKTTLPLSEDMPPTPKNNYGVQKLAAEYYCETWRKTYGLPTVSLRYFNVFGEEQPADNPYTGVITKFLDFRKRGVPLTVYGDGLQTRDFTYVQDVVHANILGAENPVEGVFNIGSGRRNSINEITRWLGGEVEYLPQREGDTLHTQADITRAKEVLGWQPSVNLEEWIKKQL